MVHFLRLELTPLTAFGLASFRLLKHHKSPLKHLLVLVTKFSRKMATHDFTEPTTNYWQEILSSDHTSSPPWKYGVPARLPDSRILMLPIRPLNNETNDAVASLLVNQAAIEVVAELGTFLADVVRPFHPEIIIGLPTLGLSLAPIVAQKLGLSESLCGSPEKCWTDNTALKQNVTCH